MAFPGLLSSEVLAAGCWEAVVSKVWSMGRWMLHHQSLMSLVQAPKSGNELSDWVDKVTAAIANEVNALAGSVGIIAFNR